MGVLDALICAGGFRIVKSFALAVCKSFSIAVAEGNARDRMTYVQ